MVKKKKENRGGPREGAGRPKTREDTIVMRVPVSLEQSVKDFIRSEQKKLLK